jgi:hypothetical protein
MHRAAADGHPRTVMPRCRGRDWLPGNRGPAWGFASARPPDRMHAGRAPERTQARRQPERSLSIIERVPPLLSAKVVPLYAQVVLYDEMDPDGLPAADTDEESVVAGFSGLTAATRSDWVETAQAVLPIQIEVWEDSAPQDDDLHVAWEGEITIGTTGVMVGSVVGASLHRVSVAMGRRMIRGS